MSKINESMRNEGGGGGEREEERKRLSRGEHRQLHSPISRRNFGIHVTDITRPTASTIGSFQKLPGSRLVKVRPAT